MKSFSCILLFLVIVVAVNSLCPGSSRNCTDSEVCSNCGSACPTTCQSVCKKPGPCIDLCKPGCVCKPGFILQNEASLKCIEPSKCARCACPKNEIWTKCNPKCEPTCNPITNPPKCVPANPCLPGCICAIGFLRNEANGMCVPLNKCSS